MIGEKKSAKANYFSAGTMAPAAMRPPQRRALRVSDSGRKAGGEEGPGGPLMASPRRGPKRGAAARRGRGAADQFFRQIFTSSTTALRGTARRSIFFVGWAMPGDFRVPSR